VGVLAAVALGHRTVRAGTLGIDAVPEPSAPSPEVSVADADVHLVTRPVVEGPAT
jgi:hypothetical protein